MVETFEVEFVREGVTLDIPANGSILDVGEANGLTLPYRCRMGICGVCSARRTGGGEIEQSEGMFLADSEKAGGYVLTCIGKPRSDLRILTNTSP